MVVYGVETRSLLSGLGIAVSGAAEVPRTKTHGFYKQGKLFFGIQHIETLSIFFVFTSLCNREHLFKLR